jgi:hypothetical protein
VELFLFLCLPCTFYFFIPQTESLFFLCSTLLIYGIHTEKKSVIFLAIYFATLTRASFLFFIIPFFGITLLSEPKSEVFRGKKWLEFLLIYILPILLGVGTVGLLQHVQTGNFFAYYDVQSSHWGRKLSMPLLPFGRINTPVSILNLNYLSFWLGAISIVLGAKFLYKWAVENISFSSPTQKMVVFSIGYLVMSWCSVVFLNPKWNWIDDGHGGLSTTCSVGINRYMSSNAFTLIGLLYLFDRPRLSPKMLVGLFFFTHVVWLTVVPHFYTHIQHYLKLVVVTLILIACWVYQHYKWKPLGYALALGSLYFQCILLDYFLTGTQVE